MDAVRTTLVHRLRQRFANDFDGGLLAVAMDHCPSEQLIRGAWHTTTLVGADHVGLLEDLAANTARRMSRDGRGLTKWVNAPMVYRRMFLDHFLDAAAESPVSVLSVSAKGEDISRALPDLLSQLGADGHYSVDHVSRKFTFGPLLQGNDPKPLAYTLPANQAAMCAFVAHFAIRMHQAMSDAVNQSGVAIDRHINWQLFADRFPNSIEGPMYKMFVAFMGLYRGRGAIRTNTFLEKSHSSVEIIADNVAGALDMALRSGRDISLSTGPGVVYWELWR